jgi:hypothetical protein
MEKGEQLEYLPVDTILRRANGREYLLAHTERGKKKKRKSCSESQDTQLR